MKKITYPIIIAAKQGNREAIQLILRHYEQYINHHSRRSIYDSYGNLCTFIDEEIKSRIQTRLLYQIIVHFDPMKPPKSV